MSSAAAPDHPAYYPQLESREQHRYYHHHLHPRYNHSHHHHHHYHHHYNGAPIVPARETAWSSLCANFRHIYRRMCFAFCGTCCCCCPASILPATPTAKIRSSLLSASSTSSSSSSSSSNSSSAAAAAATLSPSPSCPQIFGNRCRCGYNNRRQYKCGFRLWASKLSAAIFDHQHPNQYRRKNRNNNTSNNNHTNRNHRNRRLTAICIIPPVWIVALLLSVPHSWFTKLTTYDIVQPPMTRCTINNFPDAETRLRLTLYSFVTQYALPLGLTIFFYAHIGVFLWRRNPVGLSEGRRIVLLQRKRRRVRMLIYVVIAFVVTWAPLNAYLLLVDYNVIAHRQLIFFGVHWFAMSSVCWNPFIYCWLNEAFRTKTKNILKCILPQNCVTICAGRRLATSGSTSGPHRSSINPLLLRAHRWRRTNEDAGAAAATENGGVKVGAASAGGATGEHGGETGAATAAAAAAAAAAAGTGSIVDSKNRGDESLGTSWSSNSQSGGTGRQHAISELISMSGLMMDRELLDSSIRYSNIGSSAAAAAVAQYSKEHRLALMTTQSGRRRHHCDSHQLMMMLKMADEPTATKTTSINLASSPSSASSIEMQPTSTTAYTTTTTSTTKNTTTNTTTNTTSTAANAASGDIDRRDKLPDNEIVA